MNRFFLALVAIKFAATPALAAFEWRALAINQHYAIFYRKVDFNGSFGGYRRFDVAAVPRDSHGSADDFKERAIMDCARPRWKIVGVPGFTEEWQQIRTNSNGVTMRRYICS